MPRPRCLLVAFALTLAACSQPESLLPVLLPDAGVKAPPPVEEEPPPDPDAGLPEAGVVTDAGADPGVLLGAPCDDTAACDDDVPCTVDTCDKVLGRCKHVVDSTLCDDGVHCNGDEVCHAQRGCIPGASRTCTDGDPCTLDRCDEASRGCLYEPRDIDVDGDPDIYCGGTDCDDYDPLISGQRAEICANAVDDNCDGAVDEEACVAPQNDTCDDAATLEAPGSLQLSVGGAKLDSSASCAPPMSTTLRDVFATIIVPEGPPRDLDVLATFTAGTGFVSLRSTCADAASELTCALGSYTGSGGLVARGRLHGAAPGSYTAMVLGDYDGPISLNVSLGDATPVPDNETCATAAAISPDTPVLVPLTGAKPDLLFTCGGYPGGELVYRLDLDGPADVRATAAPADGLGSAQVGFFADPCAMPTDLVACATGAPARAFRRVDKAGPLFIAVRSSTGGDVSLLVTAGPPTTPPPDETCAGSPPLPFNQTIAVDVANHTDDVSLCSSGVPESVYALTLAETSDVLLVTKLFSGDSGNLGLARAPCEGSPDLIACKPSYPMPMRISKRNLEAGDYRAFVELALATPAELTAFVRKPAVPLFVPFGDTCDDAFVIPAEGGIFQGNTANLNAQYSAGCDQSNTGPVGAPDQLLRLDLPSKSRVVLDMQGSAYKTLLDVRRGPGCPGDEVPLACTVGASPGRSFLDVELEPGSYFLQIDGLDGDAGAWVLDVWVVPL